MHVVWLVGSQVRQLGSQVVQVLFTISPPSGGGQLARHWLRCRKVPGPQLRHSVAKGPEQVRQEISQPKHTLGGPTSGVLVPVHVGRHCPESRKFGALQAVHSVERGPEQSRQSPWQASQTLFTVFPKKLYGHVGMQVVPLKKLGSAHAVQSLLVPALHE